MKLGKGNPPRGANFFVIMCKNKFNSRFRICKKKSKNFIELDKSEVEEYISKMKYIRSNKKTVNDYITGINDISTQLGKIIYSSHSDFLTLKRGKYYLFDDEPVYLYIHRYDGEKGIIPKEVCNEIEVEPISILEIMELRTKLAEPDRSGYSFNWKKEKGDLIKFGIIKTNKKSKLIKDFIGLHNLLTDLILTRKLLYSNYNLLSDIRENTFNYNRDGYL